MSSEPTPPPDDPREPSELTEPTPSTGSKSAEAAIPEVDTPVRRVEPIRHHIASSTHVGRVRDANQDRSLTTGEMFAVADGMGGHVGGEKAASVAIGELAGHRGLLDVDRLVEAAEAANRRVYAEAAEPSLRGMGTTLVAAVVDDEAAEVRIVNVGDSRGYRYRAGQLLQITIDHSLVEDLVRTGRLTAEEARVHPQRNIVTRVLGMGNDVDVDVFVVTAVPGDRFLLASDGLFDELDDADIIDILETEPEIDRAADRLVAAAVEAGGRDNVTVCLADIFDIEGRRPELATVGASRPDPTGEATAEIAPVQAGEVFQAVAEPNPPMAPGGDAAPSSEARIVELELEHDLRLEAEPAVLPSASPTETMAKRPSTTRLAVLTVVTVAVLAGVFGTRWYARSAWFATEQDGAVVIMNGRPGGVLWWGPELVESTDLDAATLDDASREQLAAEREWASLADAERFVANLSQASAAAEAAEAANSGG